MKYCITKYPSGNTYIESVEDGVYTVLEILKVKSSGYVASIGSFSNNEENNVVFTADTMEEIWELAALEAL